MRPSFSTLLAPGAAAALLVAGGVSVAASAPVTEELLAPLTSAYMRAVKPGEEAELYRDLFQTVLQRVQRSYPRDVDFAGLMAVALKKIEPLKPQSGEPAGVFNDSINAALAWLDPHSYYLDPRQQRNERRTIEGTFGGVDLEVEMVEGVLHVTAPMPGTQGARAGLEGGDAIVRLDGELVQGLALRDAVSRLRGEPGTSVALTIRRGENEFSVSLVREILHARVLRWSMEGEVLVLRLASFMGQVSAEVEKAMADAAAVGHPRGVVVDLRGNLGGVFREAVRTADFFLAEGEIVSMRGRNPANWRTWHADPAELLPGVPVVVLIDGGTASVSELVAAALQENGRATVIGQRSFGKGSVQFIDSLGDGKGALYVTTALYHGPSGRSVQLTGVGPDIELLFASGDTGGWRREAERPNALPGGDEPLPPKALVDPSRCVAVQANVDPALACALVFLRAGGIDAFRAALDTAPQMNAGTRR